MAALTRDRRLSAGKMRIGRYSWEIMLLFIFVAVNLMNFGITPYYKFSKLLNATNSFLDKGFITMSMTFIILTGFIDISVASIVALSSAIMAYAFNAGLPMPLAMALCLAVGSACGAVNGLILVKFKELAPMIVTLSTQIIYRGLALLLLGDQASGNFPAWFKTLGWGNLAVGTLKIPVMLLSFITVFVIYAFILHKTNFGRTQYAIGKNAMACRFSGINVDKVIFVNYLLNGLMASVTALFLTSRMGSTRPNVAVAYEMDVIAMVVLGGISTAGGKGRIAGVFIAVFTIGFLRYGLGLINMDQQIILIIIGALMILSVAAQEVKTMMESRTHKRRVAHDAQSHPLSP